jgi:hypothetical protein
VIADGLNPFSISHMARITSLDMIGRYNIIEGVMIFVISSRFTNISNIDPKNPQMAIVWDMGTIFAYLM